MQCLSEPTTASDEHETSFVRSASNQVLLHHQTGLLTWPSQQGVPADVELINRLTIKYANFAYPKKDSFVRSFATTVYSSIR